MFMQQEFYRLKSSETGTMVDEAEIVLPVRLRHVLPNTLFTVCLASLDSYVMRNDSSIIEMQTFKEWASLEEFCDETGYTLETTIDAWKGEIINPDLEAW